MGRIRTIKPEFPQSESIGKLSRDARLLFLQLFTIADDEGRARAPSRMLASLLYPYDDDAPELIGEWLDELEHKGRIIRYAVEGSTYLQIVNWLEHQKIEKPSKSKLPAPPAEPDLFSLNSTRPRDPSGSSRRTVIEASPTDMDQGRDQGREEEKENEKDARERASSFDQFWNRWKAKVGNEGEAVARREWEELGCEPHVQEIIAGVDRYVANKPKDRLFMAAGRFLRDERWRDHAPTEVNGSHSRVFVEHGTVQWEAWKKHRKATTGRPINASDYLVSGRHCDGLYFPSEWPPGHGPPDASLGHPDLATADEDAA
jgi:hypothetical protein